MAFRVTYRFTPGQYALSQELNQNFDDIERALNDFPSNAGGSLSAGCIDTAQLADNCANEDTLGLQSIGAAELGNGAITESKLAEKAVDNGNVADKKVKTEHINSIIDNTFQEGATWQAGAENKRQATRDMIVAFYVNPDEGAHDSDVQVVISAASDFSSSMTVARFGCYSGRNDSTYLGCTFVLPKDWYAKWINHGDKVAGNARFTAHAIGSEGELDS